MAKKRIKGYKPHKTAYPYNPNTIYHDPDWVFVSSSWIDSIRLTVEVINGEGGGTEVTPYSTVLHHLSVTFKNDGFQCTYMEQGRLFIPMWTYGIEGSFGGGPGTFLRKEIYNNYMYCELIRDNTGN